MYATLTVYETLLFAAMLRLPKHKSKAEKVRGAQWRVCMHQAAGSFSEAWQHGGEVQAPGGRLLRCCSGQVSRPHRAPGVSMH